LTSTACPLSVTNGHFDGKVQADDGTWIPIEHLLGWAEEMRARW
jgi:hypothetical protein